MNPKKILITRPAMYEDMATHHTYYWADPVIKYARSLGYDILDYQKKNVTYNNVTAIMKSYNPDVYIHFGHGCPSNLIGQEECVITNGRTSYNVGNSKYLDSKSNPFTYRMDDDYMCDRLCPKESNVALLRRKDAITYSCHSASRLGVCAMSAGAKSYAGFDDYLIFMTDSVETENIFKGCLLTYTYSLLNGDTIRTAASNTYKEFDNNIKKYKNVSYLGKLLMWDRMAFKVYGDGNQTLFS
jgi:hypothetical protein